MEPNQATTTTTTLHRRRNTAPAAAAIVAEANAAHHDEQHDHMNPLDSMAASLQNLYHDPATKELLAMPGKALDKAEEIARRVWTAVHHQHLPAWLRDNDYLLSGHRPQLHSFAECFRSIFRIHTETGNIWTHLIGFIVFIVLAASFFAWPWIEIRWQEVAVFSVFFGGAILCLGFSFLFHTVYCHSEKVGYIFGKLDYCGIALLTMGSFVPWLYYSFYCRMPPKIGYLVLIVVLGTLCILVSMCEQFSHPKFRPLRAGLFIGLGLSGVIPATHFVITDGIYHAVDHAALHWVILMAILYITGAVIYACRIPERIWPGRFDIWFQSHQIFHMFVVAAAAVHLYGMYQVARNRPFFEKYCPLPETDTAGTDAGSVLPADPSVGSPLAQ
jgi:adiponectin receptor